MRRPVQAGLANTDISGRPACVFFSLAKGGLHSPFSFFLSSRLPSISLYRLHFFNRLLSGSELGPLSLSVSPSVFVTLSHLFHGASGEHELWKDNRQVMGEVCGRVCVLCGGGCAHLHVCTYAQMTKATVRLRQLNPI